MFEVVVAKHPPLVWLSALTFEVGPVPELHPLEFEAKSVAGSATQTPGFV